MSARIFYRTSLCDHKHRTYRAARVCLDRRKGPASVWSAVPPCCWKVSA